MPKKNKIHGAAAAAPAVVPPRFRDRIKELRRVPAGELLANEKNWRRHPDEQTAALTSMMARLGLTDAVIAYEKDGALKLLDGHLRRNIAADQSIPVLVLDLNDKEADLFLATFDPLGDLALMDSSALKSLLDQTGLEDEDAFLRKMYADVNSELAVEMEQSAARPKEVEGMALEPHEHYDYLVVLAQSSHEWNVLCDRLGLKPEQRRAKIGTARAIRATRLLEKLNVKA
jgi:hypothetical protein